MTNIAKTQIFETHQEFKNREDKSVNGVSSEFAERYPNWRQTNETNEGCWNCVGCEYCTYCANCQECKSCKHCRNYCAFCTNCINCVSCCSCHNCLNCLGCNFCTDCTHCYDGFKGENSSFTIRGKEFTPSKVEGIHQKVYEAASQYGALDMDDWHTCETTHCRAGWVVTLAGKDGKELEEKTDTAFAAMVIYHASSDVEVAQSAFFVGNEEALKDIKRCAEEEAKSEN